MSSKTCINNEHPADCPTTSFAHLWKVLALGGVSLPIGSTFDIQSAQAWGAGVGWWRWGVEKRPKMTRIRDQWKRKKGVYFPFPHIWNVIRWKFYRQKKKSLDFVKQILAFAFSQVGVVVLCVMYAVGGARIYMSMEVQNQNNTFPRKFVSFFVHGGF